MILHNCFLDSSYQCLQVTCKVKYKHIKYINMFCVPQALIKQNEYVCR